MSGQIVQHRAYIGGIEIPITSVSVSTSENTIWVANINCPWSPFLTKLPKNTKITVFHRNTDLFNSFRLLCDGCLAGVTEVTAWKGQAGLTLHITADTSILGWRRKAIIDLEFMLSKEALGIKNYGIDSYTQTTGLQLSVPTELSMFAPRELTKGDACKAAAYFLSGTPTDNQPAGKKFHDNGYIVSSDSSGDTYDYMSPFMKRFYQDYKMARKICHVPLPDIWIKAIADQENWEMFTNSLHPISGMTSYWTIGQYITNWFQGAILSIPDATYLGPKVGANLKQPIPDSIKPQIAITPLQVQPFEVGAQGNALAELIIMPHNYFGNAPLCNIIFPDQILRRMNSINHGYEYTRSDMIGLSVPENSKSKEDGLKCYNYHAPSGLSGYFKSFNLNVHTTADVRSEYEEQFGISLLSSPMPESMARLWTPKPDTEGAPSTVTSGTATSPLYNTLNHEFMIAYSQKFTTEVEVMPDVEVVPGSSVILLNENGEHTVAYCKGVVYSWDINGQVSTVLQLAYAHHYSWLFEGAIHYGNALSDIQPELAKIYSALIGSKIETMSNMELAIKYFNLWQDQYNQDSRQMKYHNEETGIVRDVCTMQEYVTFMGGDWAEVSAYDFSDESTFTTLGKTLVDKFDCTKEMAALSCASYTYYDPFLKTPMPSEAVKPDFKSIGQPGPLKPSTYISGIVDCHLKWLKNVGHAMSV